MRVENLAAFLAGALSESPVLGRLLMASVELAVLAGLVWLVESILLRRHPRIAALLWAVVMANAVLSLAFDAPVSVTVFSLPGSVQTMEPDTAADAGSIYGNSPGEGVTFAKPFAEGEDPGFPVSSKEEGDWRQAAWRAACSSFTNPGTALLSLWVSGGGVFVLLALRDRFRLWRLIRDAREPEEEVQRRFNAVAAELGVRKLPRLAVTRILDSPAIVGAFRPVILVPAWMLGHADLRRLTWALRHELTHAKMADPLVNALSQLTRILYFFHPMAWWAARRWKAAMELACDHALLHSDEDIRDYLETLRVLLTSIQSRRKPKLSCGLFAVRSQLGKRVAALVCMPLRPKRTSPAAVACIVILAIAALCVGGHIAPAAQAQDSRLTPARNVMQFPEDHTVGMLFTQPMGTLNEDAWEPWTEAQGAVSAPDGVHVRLELAWEATEDLSPLAALGRDDLQSIVIRMLPKNWSEFRHLDKLNLWEFKYRPMLCYGASADGTGPTPPSEVLRFPKDRAMGYVYVSATPLIPEEDEQEDGWEPWQEARGAVIVPTGRSICRLELSDEAMKDISPLAALGERDLRSISFHKKPRSWEDLVFIQGLDLWEIEYTAPLGYGGGAPKEK